MRRKTLAVISMAAMLMMGMATTSFAAPGTTTTTTNGPSNTTTNTTTNTTKNGWVSVQDGRETIWYYYANGVRYENQWLKSNNIWYYLGDDGVMVTGWHYIDNIDYYFDTSSGAMATGWKKISEDKQTSSGPMGTSSSGSNWYYFATTVTGNGYTEGEVVTGWLRVGTNWYYLADDDVDSDGFEEGQMVYGQVEIDGNEYYFGKENEGVMQTGFIKASAMKTTSTSLRPGSSSSSTEGTYYYNSDGTKKVSSWLYLDNSWYYFDEDGLMVTGKMANDASGDYVDYDSSSAKYYYYLDTTSGKMQTGWVTVKDEETNVTRPTSNTSSEKYYQYYNSSGEMRFGWLNTGNKWYYLAKEEDLSDSTFDGYALGQMATDLKEIDGDFFYFNSNGTMEASTWKTIDGSYYYFGSDGAMIRSNSQSDLNVFKVSGKWYVVDTDGARLENTTIYLTKAGKYTLEKPSDDTTLKATYTVSSKGYVSAS